MTSPPSGCCSAIRLRRLRRDRVRVRAGRGGLRLRSAPRARRAHPDRRLRRRHQRLHDHLDRTRRAPPRTQASDIIGTDGVPIAGDAFDKRIIRNLVAPRLGMGGEYSLAAEQVPAGAQLAVRTARTLALPVVPEVAADAGDARADSAHRVDAGAARSLPAADQQRARLPAARGGAAHQVRAVVGDGRAEFAFESGPVTIRKKVTRADFETLDRGRDRRRCRAASIG